MYIWFANCASSVVVLLPFILLYNVLKQISISASLVVESRTRTDKATYNIPYGFFIDRYLLEHPDKAEGVDLSLFSFQTLKPLWKNFVQKSMDHVASPDGNVDGTLKSSQGACETCADNWSVILGCVDV